MGFKKAMERMKKRIRSRRGLLLASILLLLLSAGTFWTFQHMYSTTLADHPSTEVFADWVDGALDRTLLHPSYPSYFGLDQNNYITLYEGKPLEGKVVHSYFQLDMAHMENSLPTETIQELIRGIHVTDDAEFYSVLSTFSDYAIDSRIQQW